MWQTTCNRPLWWRNRCKHSTAKSTVLRSKRWSRFTSLFFARNAAAPHARQRTVEEFMCTEIASTTASQAPALPNRTWGKLVFNVLRNKAQEHASNYLVFGMITSKKSHDPARLFSNNWVLGVYLKRFYNALTTSRFPQTGFVALSHGRHVGNRSEAGRHHSRVADVIGHHAYDLWTRTNVSKASNIRDASGEVLVLFSTAHSWQCPQRSFAYFRVMYLCGEQSMDGLARTVAPQTFLLDFTSLSNIDNTSENLRNGDYCSF